MKHLLFLLLALLAILSTCCTGQTARPVIEPPSPDVQQLNLKGPVRLLVQGGSFFPGISTTDSFFFNRDGYLIREVQIGQRSRSVYREKVLLRDAQNRLLERREWSLQLSMSGLLSGQSNADTLWEQEVNTYDDGYLKESRLVQRRQSDTLEFRITQYAYDDRGNQIRVEEADNLALVRTLWEGKYNAESKLIEFKNTRTDSSGQSTVTIRPKALNPLGEEVIWLYDNVGYEIKKEASGKRIQYIREYNPEGQAVTTKFIRELGANDITLSDSLLADAVLQQYHYHPLHMGKGEPELVSQLTYKEGRLIWYYKSTFDKQGKLVRFECSGDSIPGIIETYDAFENPVYYFEDPEHSGNPSYEMRMKSFPRSTGERKTLHFKYEYEGDTGRWLHRLDYEAVGNDTIPAGGIRMRYDERGNWIRRYPYRLVNGFFEQEYDTSRRDIFYYE